MRLEDKVAIITGAAHGLGKAYAHRFAAEGASVVVADIDATAGEAVGEEVGGCRYIGLAKRAGADQRD